MNAEGETMSFDQLTKQAKDGQSRTHVRLSSDSS